MKQLMLYCLLVVLVANGCKEKEEVQDNPLLTRTEIIALIPTDSSDRPDRHRSRLYAELDLTTNGLKDIIISEELGMKGTGGITWFIYRCVGDDQYQLATELGGWPLAVEEDEWECKRIWSYWHERQVVGHIGYLRWGLDGKITHSPALELYRHSEVGDGIYNSVFNNNTLLPMRKISPASPTSDLPYVDEPWKW